MPATRPEDIPVVILCGGMGTRLREETERIPKPLVDIGGRPILWHIMKVYGHHGFKRYVLCLGYRSWLIKEYFLRYREQLADFTIKLSEDHQPEFHNDVADEDWAVTCVETGLHAGTGARLWRVRDHLDGAEFMFTYGDGIAPIDLTALVEFHRSHGLVGTVTGVHPGSRYGEMRVEDHTVAEFNEKPTNLDGYVSGGFFMFRREFLDYLTPEPDLMVEHSPLQKLARDGQLAVFPHSDYWLGMDTFRDWQELNGLWESGTPPWKVWAD